MSSAVHRRLQALDHDQALRDEARDRLFIVALPGDNGGDFNIVATSGYKSTERTVEFNDLCAQLRAIPDLVLVALDPLPSFNDADINADPAAARALTGALSDIAARTGATVLALHHVRKMDRPPRTRQEARAMIEAAPPW